MTPRQKRRLALVGVIITGLTAATLLTVNAFQQNLLFFLTPTQVAAGEATGGERQFRLGGMVAVNSVQHLDGVRVRFAVTDFSHSVAVEYEGVLPDLFREGQGVVVLGAFENDLFYASEVLAKHDENYMPPEVHDALSAAKTLEQEN